jgi:tocopherol O-methyltransferase
LIRPAVAVSADAVARHYDELDVFYRALWGEHVHHGYWRTGRESTAEAAEALVGLVADRLRLSPGETVCDVGCGYGATARLLAARHGVDVTGVTVSRAQLAHATAAPGVRLRLLDWLANDFADASFDALYAIESTEHMADLPRFFAEAFRVLRPGRRLVVCAWLHRPSPAGWERRHLLEPICREGRLAQLGTGDEYRALAAEADFSEIRVEDISRHVSRTWSVCLARLVKALASNEHGARRFLLDRGKEDRIFALTLLRLRLAYATGALQYGVLSARRS